jgi:hypothetical protein
MPLIDFIIGIMTVYRLSSLLSYENGPFEIFVRIRRWAGIMHDDEGIPIQWPRTFFGELLSCLWCNSVWMGFFWIVAYCIHRDLTIYSSVLLALSTGAIIINRWTRG